MDVAMNEIFRPVTVNKPVKTVKAFMAAVFRIMNTPWRGMGNDQVKPALPPDSYFQITDNTTHLSFGILIGANRCTTETLQAPGY